MSSSSETLSSKRRSALRAPMVSCPVLMGTQIKEMSFFSSPRLAPVRLRNRGSCETRGTITGWPL